MRQGINVYLRGGTFGDWIEHCNETAANLGPTTRETYRQHTRLYILSQPIAKIRLADLRPSDLREWAGGVVKIRSERTRKRLSANTIRKAYDRIRTSLVIAFEDERIGWLPPKS